MVGGLLAVDHQPALEEPVPRVLAVGLGDVETFDIGGVAPDAVDKEVGVVVEVPVVEGEPHLTVEPLECRPALVQHRHLDRLLRLDPRIEARERLRVGTLGHPVVNHGQKIGLLPVCQRRRCLQQISSRALDTTDLVQPAGTTDRHRIGRPGGAEVHPRTDLEHLAVATEKTRRTKAVRLEGLPQQPAECFLLLPAQLTGGLDV